MERRSEDDSAPNASTPHLPCIDRPRLRAFRDNAPAVGKAVMHFQALANWDREALAPQKRAIVVNVTDYLFCFLAYK